MRSTVHIRTMAAVVLVVGAALGAVAAGTAHAKSVVVLPRPGQVGVGLSGLYGTLLDNGTVGDQFGSGPGMAVRLRYRMRYERAIGLSFESHGLDVRPGDQVDLFDGKIMKPQDEFAYQRVHLGLYGLDVYQMFGTRTKVVKMLSVGGGIARATFGLNDGEHEFPLSDGTYLSVGVGVERFFWTSMAFDFGARYHAVFLGHGVNHDLQASAGLIFYASL